MSNLVPSPGSNLIPVEKAKEMTARYRENKSTILAPAYVNTDVLAISETLSADDVKLLFSQPNCVGLRIYYGMDEGLLVKAILVGVAPDGSDIIIPNLQFNTVTAGYVVDDTFRCPPICPPTTF